MTQIGIRDHPKEYQVGKKSFLFTTKTIEMQWLNSLLKELAAVEMV